MDMLKQTKPRFDTSRSSIKKILKAVERSEMPEGMKIREPAQLPTHCDVEQLLDLCGLSGLLNSEKIGQLEPPKISPRPSLTS